MQLWCFPPCKQWQESLSLPKPKTREGKSLARCWVLLGKSDFLVKYLKKNEFFEKIPKISLSIPMPVFVSSSSPKSNFSYDPSTRSSKCYNFSIYGLLLLLFFLRTMSEGVVSFFSSATTTNSSDSMAVRIPRDGTSRLKKELKISFQETWKTEKVRKVIKITASFKVMGGGLHLPLLGAWESNFIISNSFFSIA